MWTRTGGGFSLSLQAQAHLSVAVLKVAQLETLLQFGLMPHPELIESPFCLIQLGQQPGKREETTTSSVKHLKR